MGARNRHEADPGAATILAGDLAAAFAYTTPARGVIIVPMAPLGLRERDAGTVTVTSSYGLPNKLDRLRRNPAVALATTLGNTASARTRTSC